ncbi:jg16231 [Pararge aegeria aegeria]|uniref:Jg16231 protein n=1 Tax=Pararge aegeria aegeria TaxID=348720 RepID=A0A8S4RTQ7_9NEOP|nr:jg16231 [Pararge aegeria aegeria]
MFVLEHIARPNMNHALKQLTPRPVSCEGCLCWRCVGVLTRIRPVVVWPEMSSPAQSLASVMKVPSNSCLPWRAAFCSFCLGSLGDSSGSRRQHMKAPTRHATTTMSPAANVMIDDKRKHHHFRSLRQSSSLFGAVVASSSDEAIPRGREASRQTRHARAATRGSHAGPRATEPSPTLAAPYRSMARDRSAHARRPPATARPCRPAGDLPSSALRPPPSFLYLRPLAAPFTERAHSAFSYLQIPLLMNF